MSRSLSAPLWIKLTGVLAAVIAVGVTVTVVLARQGAVTQISHVMMGNRMVRPTILQQQLINYYAEQRDWAGLETALGPIVAASSPGGMMGGMMDHPMNLFDGRVLVLDERGQLVAGLGAAGATSISGVEQGWPLVVNGERVGTLLVEGAAMGALHAGNDALVEGVTRAVSIAALTAGLVALLLGALLTRQITRPLAALNVASRRIAAGERDVRVVVESGDEVGQLARTFNRMAEALAEQEGLRRGLMADVAHELRTPLAGIQGTVEAMQDGVFPLTAARLDTIHEQIVLLNRLVDDLRTLAHAEAGQLSLQLEAVDLSALTAGVVGALKPQAESRTIDLSWEAIGVVPPIRADSERLRQVLLNLMGNALRHTPTGGIVSVLLTHRESNVDGGMVDGVTIRVRDDGEGIPAADLDRIFNRFYRGDPSRSRHTGGSGLGLAIARQLVEVHGGRIWAESPPPGEERGSQFSIWLPTQRREEDVTL